MLVCDGSIKFVWHHLADYMASQAETTIFIVTAARIWNLTALHLLLSIMKAFSIIFRIVYVVIIWELDSRLECLLNIGHYGQNYFHYSFSMNVLIANTKLHF
jgi:hypothetical protein